MSIRIQEIVRQSQKYILVPAIALLLVGLLGNPATAASQSSGSVYSDEFIGGLSEPEINLLVNKIVVCPWTLEDAFPTNPPPLHESRNYGGVCFLPVDDWDTVQIQISGFVPNVSNTFYYKCSQSFSGQGPWIQAQTNSLDVYKFNKPANCSQVSIAVAAPHAGGEIFVCDDGLGMFCRDI